ncbi:MAG: helix-turn-helix domain-containing protein [Rhodospirillales bacterium]|nr:helix-turn-helix domain-containing protein [Rhodospirillales bacterium]
MDGPSLITSLDSGLRGAAIAVFLIVAISILRQGYRRPVVWLGAALSIGAAAYAICSLPGNAHHRTAWFAPVLALCAGNVAVFWLFTRAAFDDSFRPAPWHALLWLLLVACPLADLFGAGLADNQTLEIVRRIVPVGLVLLALAQTIKDWGADLVEGRRRLRLFILGAVLLHSAVSATVDLSLGPQHVPPPLHLLNAAALAAIAAVIAVTALHADLDIVFAGPAAALPAPPAAVSPPQEPVDPAVLAELDRLMTVDRLYRQEGLTIGALAAKLGLPEHRLRRTINRGLGFRNFNEYLNGHRLADAKQALADPSQAEVPILTIALDSGFQSLGPFNRAFKTDTGMTPTEFRRSTAGRNGG